MRRVGRGDPLLRMSLRGALETRSASPENPAEAAAVDCLLQMLGSSRLAKSFWTRIPRDEAAIR